MTIYLSELYELDEADKIEFTIEEIKALNKFLQHQYISYEDLALLEVVRKISRIANDIMA